MERWMQMNQTMEILKKGLLICLAGCCIGVGVGIILYVHNYIIPSVFLWFQAVKLMPQFNYFLFLALICL